ncbi:hypothetical protein SteCoe_7943 [Stentor coeruleus]|uniref:Uncharacterized protein n=1 Tax=Stentor coeruleus TaxID=5963 RepID=A0A1R2CLH2_9CILI|nr:hypothetical protein SteCoe_7943 [Stentor coeruleus]
MTEMLEEYKDLKRRLKKTIIYKQLTDIIYSVVCTEMRVDYKFMKRALPCLKKILSDMVDSAWNSTKSSVEISQIKPIKHIRHITSVPKLKKDAQAGNHLAKSSDTLQKSANSKDDRSHQSDYSYIKGPVSFAKSIRDIDKVRAASPGPSYYFFDTLKQKIQSPRVVFPKSVGHRSSYIPNSLSPGPSKYYPSIRSIVKYA